jgi:HD superfamily phosphodiesterase
MLTNEEHIVYLHIEDVIRLTGEIGEDWAIAHAKRLIELIKQISDGLPFDEEIIELAAYMHDWGAFPKYRQKDVEHAIRSRQVVEAEILPRLSLTRQQKQVLLETIELHDYRDQRLTTSNEALLLREADMLEFLGMIGMARDFARGPRNVETCTRRIIARREAIQGRFRLPRAQSIARVRLERMEIGLQWLDEESFGIL